MKVKLISLVIPCYNKSETVYEFYRRVDALTSLIEPAAFEFIFVNDGSTDETEMILNNLAAEDCRVKVLHLAHNRGHQIALTAGMDHSVGYMIVTMDADLQHPPELILKLMVS